MATEKQLSKKIFLSQIQPMLLYSRKAVQGEKHLNDRVAIICWVLISNYLL